MHDANETESYTVKGGGRIIIVVIPGTSLHSHNSVTTLCCNKSLAQSAKRIFIFLSSVTLLFPTGRDFRPQNAP